MFITYMNFRLRLRFGVILLLVSQLVLADSRPCNYLEIYMNDPSFKIDCNNKHENHGYIIECSETKLVGEASLAWGPDMSFNVIDKKTLKSYSFWAQQNFCSSEGGNISFSYVIPSHYVRYTIVGGIYAWANERRGSITIHGIGPLGDFDIKANSSDSDNSGKALSISITE